MKKETYVTRKKAKKEGQIPMWKSVLLCPKAEIIIP